MLHRRAGTAESYFRSPNKSNGSAEAGLYGLVAASRLPTTIQQELQDPSPRKAGEHVIRLERTSFPMDAARVGRA